MNVIRFLFGSISILFIFAIQSSHCRPQEELPVVRPAHFLPKGFFSHSPSAGRDGHLVPDSFYRGASDINPLSSEPKREDPVSSINTVPVTTSAGSDYNPQRQNQQQVDSYSNIGSSNNGDTSVSNAGDYGETVPGQTSSLVPSTYGSYSNNN